MKKIFVISAFVLGVFAITGIAKATVGGPTYIHSFKYNPANESVYYTEASYSGRGCPPVLMKMSLESGKLETVYSCDQGEKLLSTGAYDPSRVSAVINDMTSGFKGLSLINLRKNNITIDVNFVKTEKLSPELDQIRNSVFTATIYQNGKKLTDLQIRGCNKEQPFTFAGYAIPGFEKKIVLLLSTKSDCIEGGYVGESMYVLGGMSSINKEYVSYYKGDSAFVPNEGTLTVYEEDAAPAEQQENKTENPMADESIKKSSITVLPIGIGLAALLIGILIGRSTKRESQTPDQIK